MRGLLLTALLAPSLPLCFFRPFYGILLWTAMGILNPQDFAWGYGASFPWSAGIAIATVGGLLVFSRGWNGRLLSRECLLLILLWGWFTVTSLISTQTPMFLHHADETWTRWIFVSKILLMTVAAIAVVESFQQLRVLVAVIAGCFGIFVLKALPFIIVTRGAYRVYGPENSMLNDNNAVGLALNMTLPVFFFLAQTEWRRWRKRIFVFLFLITIPAIMCTYSRGALLGLVVVLTLMFFQLKQRLWLVPVMVLGLVFALVFAPEKWRERMDPNQGIDSSANSRLYAWTFARNLAMDYPVAGGGFRTFTPELFARYAPGGGSMVLGPHSVYFQILGEHGFAGLFLYLGVLASAFLTTFRIAKTARLLGDYDVLQYAYMFRFSLAGFVTSGFFLGLAYFDHYFTILACIAILKSTATKEWEMHFAEAGEAETAPEDIVPPHNTRTT
jgi:probable O-glycosylation ligase (exosortase A-associated)